MARGSPRPTPLGRLAAVACSGVLLLSAAACGGDDQGSGSSKGGSSGLPGSSEPDADGGVEPSAAPSPIEVEKPVQRQARATTEDYLSTLADTLARPSVKKAMSAKGQVTGTALQALRNQAEELEVNQQRVEGRPTVVEVDVVARTKRPPTVTVAACLDSSEVEVVDARGKPVPGQATARQRALNLITLVQRGDRWLVSDVTFPDDADC